MIWAISFAWFDLAVFPSYSAAFAVRGPEFALALGSIWYLRKPRSLPAVEAASIVAWTVIAALSVWGLFVVPPDKLPTKVASLAISVLVVCPLASFTWPTTAAVGVITVLALSSLRWMGHTSLVTLTLTVVGFGYAVLIVAAAARDRLKRSEYDARNALSEANHRLKLEDELRRRLFVNLSHDFRTPLAIIRGDASLMRAAGRDPSDAAALFRIEGNARALTDLTDQLLELARLEAGQVAKRPRRCDVPTFARDVAALLEPPGATRRIVTTTKSNAADDLVALVDPNHVQRILLNLVGNGLRHASGEVSIAVLRDADRVRIDVSTEGPGIPPERREAIFQRFVTFSADGSTSSGIGLPLARELAVLNGGSLVLLDETARTTFRVELPAADGPAEDVAGSAAAAVTNPPPPIAQEAPRDRARLLLVEDNADMAAMLTRVLSDSFRISHVSTVGDAVASLNDEVPQAVLSDVMLPDGTGYDVLAAVRGHRDRDGLPVILVSALGEVSERVRGLGAGADDYIAKPFAPEELQMRLASAIERAESRRRALELQRDALLMEIHDGVSASLARAAILLADETAPAESANHAREAIKDGLDEVRAITRLLSPRGSDWRSLAAEIRRAMAEACAANAITLDFEAEELVDPPPVPAPVAHTLRRIAREATTNIIKHARAKRVVCRLEVSPAFSIRIEDDGRGFPSEASEGQGLGIMARRVKRIGGTVQYGNRASGGAFVTATLSRA